MEPCGKPPSGPPRTPREWIDLLNSYSSSLTSTPLSRRHPDSIPLSSLRHNFPINKPISDDADNQNDVQTNMHVKKPCLCSPSKHPLEFRCPMHKKDDVKRASQPEISTRSLWYHAYVRLEYRRKAMYNSLMKMGGEGVSMARKAKEAHQKTFGHYPGQHRRSHFQPKPSRLSVMSKATSPVSD